MMKVTYKTIGGEEVTITEEDVIEMATQNLDSEQPSRLEIRTFMERCKQEKGNPFLGEIFIRKQIGKPAFIGSKQELLLKRARENKEFLGITDGIYVCTVAGQIEKRNGISVWPNETVIGGWCEVKVKGLDPIFEAVPLAYYFAGNGKDSPLGPNAWDKMPGTMIRKVARVAALRVAFPDSCSGYIQEEFNGYENDLESSAIVDDENHGEDISVATAETSENIINTVNSERTSDTNSQQPASAGIAGNPVSIPTEPDNTKMTLEDAKTHIVQNGPLTNNKFETVFNYPNYKELLSIYATSMTGADQEAARILLESEK